jgi:hypothetical protein
MDLEGRFWEKVIVQDGCWKWTGGKTQGYGVLTVGQRGAGVIRAHRLSYILHCGKIPTGKLVLHKCDNRECTNPDHLELGDYADNMRHVSERKRHPWSLKTHCVHGHEYTPENTVWRGRRRQCRACKNAEQKERHRKNRGEFFGVSTRQPKTHCRNGHEFTAENTYLNPSGYKECITCRRERMNAFLQRQKQPNP